MIKCLLYCNVEWIKKIGVSYKLIAKNISFLCEVFLKLRETARLNPSTSKHMKKKLSSLFLKLILTMFSWNILCDLKNFFFRCLIQKVYIVLPKVSLKFVQKFLFDNQKFYYVYIKKHKKLATRVVCREKIVWKQTE